MQVVYPLRIARSMACLFLVFHAIGYGNTLTPLIVNFDKSTYRGLRHNWAITQSPEGYLYFANSGGLLEYDGVSWTLYRLPQRQIVRTVACDSEGRIFVGGYGEFGYWRRNGRGVLIYTSLSDLVRDWPIGREEIWHILLTSRGVFFQSFSTLFHYDGKQVQVIRPPGPVIMFMNQIGGQLLAPVRGLGIYELTPAGDFRILPGSERFSDLTISFLLELPQGLLVGTLQDGLFLRKGEQFIPWAVPLRDSFRDYGLNRGLRLRDGRLVLGTLRNGFYLCDDQGRKIDHFAKENGLQNNTILALFEDRKGNLWTGLDWGIDLLVLDAPLQYFEDRSGRLGTPFTACLFESRFYVGTNQGIYRRSWPFDPADSFELVPGTQGQAWQFLVLGEQLLCGHNSGTFRIQGGKVQRISPINGGWTFLTFPDHPDLLLQGTYTGLVLLERNASGDWQYRQVVNGFDLPVKKLLRDSSGLIWVVNPREGLFRLKLSSDFQTVVEQRHIGKDQGLPIERPSGLAEIQGKILVYGENQWWEWREAAQNVRPAQWSFPQWSASPLLHLRRGWQDEWFVAFESGVAWMQGDRQLRFLSVVLNPVSPTIERLTDSLYFFGTEHGFALLPRRHRLTGLTPGQVAPVLKKVSAGRRGDIDFLPFEQNAARKLFIPPGTNYLRFQVALPSFHHRPFFRYRLHREEPWSPWTANPYVEFYRLPPGDYALAVQSSISSQLLIQPFVIPAPWYQRPPARAGYLLLFVAGIFWVLRWHRHRLRRQQRRLDIERRRQLEEQRIKAINEKLASDVRNKSKELTNSTFNLIRKNEILLQLKEELKRLKKSPAANVPSKDFQRLMHLINHHLNHEQDWEVFENNFTQVHELFLQKLKNTYPDLSPGDLKLAAYLRMNLSSKEIAPLLNISTRGVEIKRYRLRKKLHLPSEKNLAEFLIEF